MKKWLLHIMFVGMLGILAASCSQDADNPLQTGKKVKVTFTLSTGGQDAYSRTTWEGYDGDGTDDASAADVYAGEVFDNKIDPDQLQVWICNADCTPLAKVERLLHTKKNENTYKFTGTFEATISESSNYKIMVFANCSEIATFPTPLTAASVVEAMPASSAALDAIPMWGVQQVEGAKLLAEAEDIKIYVLRALARVEIALSSAMIDAGKYTLQSASFNKYNKNINCIPNGFAGITATTELATGTSSLTSGTTTVPASFNANDDDSSGSNLAFITVTEGQNLVAYVPEYELAGTDDKLDITLSLSDGTNVVEKSFTHGGYTDGSCQTPWNVVRNHYYKYEVSVQNGEDLEVIITIKAWKKLKYDYPSLGIQGLPDATTSSTN